MYPSSSLIISTYNWPEALTVCLKSALRQERLPDEIIIADDGSGSATKAVVQEFQKKSPIPITHIWHEDNGFRLAHIRNKAIAAASGEYIIQIDGDILIHSHFVSDHLRFAQKNSFVRASRIYLNEDASGQIMRTQKTDINLFNKGTSNLFSAFRVPVLWPLFATTYKNKGDERYEIHGCNMAFWKKDAVEVNGYNEAFSGWGPEDKEFVARLLNAGKHKRFLKLGGLAFHLYHPENSKHNLDTNERLLMKTVRSGCTFCNSGIDKYIQLNGEENLNGTRNSYL
ncbi:glycosyltransferase family 2 protein [Spirosoma sp. KNUC1025]|uniref:glycosyltransferase family 2 protein n=1 Tax=Spirosoma sp. KNUC1025 TaxID=2894082 RepID=UPI0038700022|nr:glycosyltransferase family 2 protein [Spirosoma sp. KNUC1025]